jgi:two-component system, OmpR family, response regulator RpaA
MARIMVVDDDHNVVDVIGRTLRRHDHVIIVAHNGRQAMELLQEQKPDLVILDIVMPEVTGLRVCQFMRTNPTLAAVPILFLTARERIEDKIAGFEAGADDYLTKPFNLVELELRVKALLRHSVSPTPTGPLVVGPIRVDPDSGQAKVDGQPVELTPVEFELLYYMVAHANEVVSSERLLQEVWGYPPGTGNASLVRMHVLNLRRKIEKDPANPTRFCTVPRHGYIVNSSPDGAK